MKELKDLHIRDKFRFTEKESKRLGFNNDVFIVLIPYTQERISVKNIETMEKYTLPGNLAIILESKGSSMKRKEIVTSLKQFHLGARLGRPVRISDILLAGSTILIIYLIVFRFLLL